MARTTHENAYALLNKLSELAGLSKDEIAAKDFSVVADAKAGAPSPPADNDLDAYFAHIPHYQVYDRSEAWFRRTECWVSKVRGRR